MYYLVIYHDIVVGIYAKDENGITFEKNKEGIELLPKLGLDIPRVLLVDHNGQAIGPFENRIRDASRFPGVELSYNFMDIWSLYQIVEPYREVR